MFRAILKTAISSLGLLFFISFFLFLLIYFLPGNVTDAMFLRSEAVSVAIKEQILENLGLKDGFFVQYFRWLAHFVTGDFGTSFVSGASVFLLIKERLLNSLILFFASFFLIVFLSFFLGLLSAIYKNKFADIFINFSSFLLASLPHFYVALVLIAIFSVYLNVLPSSGANELGSSGVGVKFIILPTLAIILPHLGANVKFVRDTLNQSLNADFIQTAHARGLGWGKIYLFAIKHASTDIVYYFATLVAGVFAGSYVIESIFSFPGIGKLSLDAVIAKDYPVALATILLTAVFVVFANLLAKIFAILADKRNL
ncbi:ABC transporter permease [Campylobacter concisus]|uniref:ABC transporter permease n=1 Tax=Campylobacter concisus TaxID=199 RepID=A0A9E1B7E1_9BACT|nr:ABC transporter permease [Campylobacter concisus]MBS5829352.1 ABC transporter permease [Campylobacter concisus]